MVISRGGSSDRKVSGRVAPKAATIGDLPPEPPRWRSVLQRTWVPAVLALVALLSTGLAVASHEPSFSPMDEYNYYDYLIRMPGQLVMHTGEFTTLQTRERLSCYGVLGFGTTMGPECGGDYSDPLNYVFQGKNTSSGYTPAYFLVTYGAAAAIRALTGVEALTAYRFTGGLWLAAAMIVFYLLLRRFGVHKSVILGLGFVLIAAPFTWLANTFISTDAPLLFFGALLVLAAVKVARREWWAWVFVLLSILAAMFKGTSLSAVLIGGLVLLWMSFQRAPTGLARRGGSRAALRWRALVVAGISVVAFYAVQRAWMEIQVRSTVAAAPNQGVPSVPLTPWVMAKLAASMVVDPINQSIDPAPGATHSNLYPMPVVLTVALSAMCVIGLLLPLAVRSGAALKALRWPVLLGYLGGPLLTAMGMALGGRYYDLQPRYGAVGLAAVMLMIGLLARPKWAKVLVCAFGGVLLVWNLGYSIILLA